MNVTLPDCELESRVKVFDPAGRGEHTLPMVPLRIAWFCGLTLAMGLSVAVGADGAAGRYWPQWRGPSGTGAAPDARPPIQWSETNHVRWKLPLPGKGHSTPVIWGELVFVTLAAPVGEAVKPVYNAAPGAHDNFPVSRHHEYVVLAVGRSDGRIRWRRTVTRQLPHEGGHYTGSLASQSPVTDGEHLYASFGSRGVFCLDYEGEVVWEKQLGEMQTRHAHGEGSSPALHGETLVINWDHQGDSFIIALDKRSGEQRWRVGRDEITSWSTPVVVEHAGGPQVIVSATGRVRGYQLATGEVLWECGGLSRNVVASPVAAEGMVYVGNSYDHQAMLAIRLEGASGDITGTDRVAWTLNRLTPYVPSPLLYDGALYFLRHNQGVLSCLDARTGKPRFDPIRLEGVRDVFASPVAAANRVYVTDRGGLTLVISHGDQPRLLAANRLDDVFSASPALVGREFYLRGEKSLYCIMEDAGGGSGQN